MSTRIATLNIRHGGTDPKVTETKCQCLGEKTCTFEMTWR